MNITYDEAWKIAGDIIAQGQNKEQVTKEILATLIYRNHDYRWNNEADKWVLNEATTAVHVAELQEESEELHRKLRATRERCDILESELARLRSTDQLVKDSINLSHIINKLDALNAPTEVNGEPLVLPVDRLAYLLSLMRKNREAAEEERALIQESETALSKRVAELSIQLGIALRERDLATERDILSSAVASERLNIMIQLREIRIADIETINELQEKLREFDAMERRFKAVSIALKGAREAINDANEKLRTATLCKCMVLEVTEGEWQTFRTADCPVHPHTIEVNWP